MGAGRAILLLAATTLSVAVAPAAPGPETGAAVAGNVQRLAAAPRPSPLRLGSRGPRVVALQRQLSALGYLPARTADGVFGMRTWHAVVALQGWQRLERDGVARASTQAALATAARPVPWSGLERGLELDLRRG